jgi:hypothetical protein
MLAVTETLGWRPELIQQGFITSEYTNIVNACNLFNSTSDEQKIQYFPGIHNHELLFLKNPKKVFKPFTYPVYDKNFDELVEVSLKTKRKIKKTEQGLFFRGYLWEPRRLIMSNTEHPEIKYDQERLVGMDYVNFLRQYRCGLSLNGQAEICNRDIEYMALGIPILRPLLKHTETHTSLVPNVHYIAFDYERHPSYVSAYFGAPTDHDLKPVSDALVARWEEVKTDYEFLEYVGQTARNWYLENGKNEQHVQLLLDNINLNLLQ